MSTNYNDQIAELELVYQLDAQKSALTKVELECLRMKQKIEDYDTTRQSLIKEIAITEDKLKALKGGGKNG
jgi:phage shock protein A